MKRCFVKPHHGFGVFLESLCFLCCFFVVVHASQKKMDMGVWPIRVFSDFWIFLTWQNPYLRDLWWFQIEKTLWSSWFIYQYFSVVRVKTALNQRLVFAVIELNSNKQKIIGHNSYISLMFRQSSSTLCQNHSNIESTYRVCLDLSSQRIASA